MKFEAVKSHITKCYQAGLRQTIFLSGPPGIGKSACVKAAAEEIGINFRAIQMTVVDPLDFGGLPAVLDRSDGHGPYAARLPFGDLVPRDGAGLLLYDDLPTAPPLSQAAAYRTVYERDHIGHNWMIIATGNRDQDRAATHRMPTPLVSKMGWLEFEPDLEGWSFMMAGKEGSAVVRAFLQHRPDLFVKFDPAVPGPFATARTWEALADLCSVYEPHLPPFESMKGWIGEGPAVEFNAFATMAAQLVHPDTILMSPADATVPEDLGALYAVTTALANKAAASNFDRIIIYLKRLQPEFAVYTVKSAIATQAGRIKAISTDEARRFRRIEQTDAFAKFAAAYGDILS